MTKPIKRKLNGRNLASIAILLGLTACASNDQARVKEAVTAPLSDLNLINAEIPQVLIHAEQQPYTVPLVITCTATLQEIQQLDAALGPDLDSTASEANPSLIERGSNEAKDAAVGVLRDTAQGVLPYRRWVRKLSGAERYSKNVASAIAAGTVRRAFLKGLFVAKNCR